MSSADKNAAVEEIGNAIEQFEPEDAAFALTWTLSLTICALGVGDPKATEIWLSLVKSQLEQNVAAALSAGNVGTEGTLQ